MKYMTPIAGLAIVFVSALVSTPKSTAQESSFRPPAYPLIACDPYFSVWSQSDQLWGSQTTHWTGKSHRLSALVRIDGTAYRLMGATPQALAAMKQVSATVLPTRTIYTFAGHGVQVTLTFTTPALPDDLLVLSRPTTYVNCEVASTDGKSHQAEFYFDASGELATNVPDQIISGESVAVNETVALKLGTQSQRVLGKSGDDLRIDWGYLYVTAPAQAEPSSAFGAPESLRASFGKQGASAVANQSFEFPTPAGDAVAAVAMSLGEIKEQPVSRYVLVAYDDLYSIEFMTKKLRPYWRKDGWEAKDLITAAMDQHDELEQRCSEFDAELMADLTAAGGREYAEIAALAYRQCFAAGKFVADANGQPLQFCKENHSNGCIATSDVFYPMAPQFLLFGPTLTKSVLVPFMKYAASERWTFPFAPHDLGTYPKANGQVYGGGERDEANQMPVEESGNMLILFAALAKMEGNADFAALYWEQLSQWADYLQQEGFDPDNQLCTDDFAGHMAHNVNLSAKAICGLGSFAMLCEMRGDQAAAEKYSNIAKDYANKWIETARDGDHYRLAFDRSGTWSQKYNLVWDRILGLGLFPAEVVETEMAYYKKIQNEYGLPLDNRSDYTKLDWVLWTATLTENREDFAALVRPVHRFLSATPDRSPMTDWYFTSTARKRGFTARPVVGGVYLQMLYDKSAWSKYTSRERVVGADWAPMPKPPETKPILSTSQNERVIWKYTTESPVGVWFAEDYAADDWREGPGGFGTRETPGTTIGTVWDRSEIWVRRSFEINSPIPEQIGLRLYHDEDAEVYLNGQKVVDIESYSGSYQLFEIPSASIRQGKNVIAIHCRQTTGGQYIDCGIDQIIPQDADAK